MLGAQASSPARLVKGVLGVKQAGGDACGPSITICDSVDDLTKGIEHQQET
jgi:hypothetical protein